MLREHFLILGAGEGPLHFGPALPGALGGTMLNNGGAPVAVHSRHYIVLNIYHTYITHILYDLCHRLLTTVVLTSIHWERQCMQTVCPQISVQGRRSSSVQTQHANSPQSPASSSSPPSKLRLNLSDSRFDSLGPASGNSPSTATLWIV